MALIKWFLLGTSWLFLSNDMYGKVSLKANCDLPGQNLKSFNVAKPKDCREACTNNQKCNGFSFISGWNKCFLKVTSRAAVEIRFFSGELGSNREVASSGWDIDYSGKDLKKIPYVTDGKACSIACIKDPKCKAFGYISGYRDCWLKKTIGKSRHKVFWCGQRT
ncbi:MAG: hypothetical protein CMP10_04020 [Zetaproteobacteria bacterium]|nr:hypothetical protein [Pseudobdellovibrionaceae bacterium]|tara:strand:- start:604 stop:1095 length:492 start_codon:yes stop_codon:yes gene_type:complete